MTAREATIYDARNRAIGTKPLTIAEAAALAGRAIDQPERIAAPPDAPWFSLQIEPQRESLAMAHLIGRSFEAYMPAAAIYGRRGRAMQWRTQPMFPGYGFLHIAPDALARALPRLRNMPGVLGLVGGVGARVAVGDLARLTIAGDDIAGMHKAERESFERKRAALASHHQPYDGPLAVGDMARLREGPFEGAEGPIIEILDADRLMLLVLVLGRPTRTWARGAALEKVD